MQYRPKPTINRLTFLSIGAVLFTTILIVRLFYIQGIQGEYYGAVAAKEHYGYVELPARRGEVIIKDYHSNEEFLLGTNTTLELLYADPSLVKNPQFVADTITPLIFDKKAARQKDDERIDLASKKMPPETTEEQKKILLMPKTDEMLLAEYKASLLSKISEKKRKEIILAEDLTQEEINQINAFKISGIEIKGNTLYAYPALMGGTSAAASHLSPIIEIPTKKLAQILEGANRYVVLARKLDPTISTKIHELAKKDKTGDMSGIGLQEEYFRYYPENTLGANIIGFVDNQGTGQYGIESAFNTELQGKKGVFQTQKDSIGRQVIAGDSVIEKAIDGDDIVLTIDRSVQLQAEKLLSKGLQDFRADSGQLMVMDPKTGFIIALAGAPSFNPNNYGEVYKKIYINLTPEDIAKLVPSKDSGIFYFYRDERTHDFYYIFEEVKEDGTKEYYRYNNYVGPAAYQNQAIQLPYEPGSVFKPIVMSAAIDDNDLKPNSTFNDSGPVGVDYNKYTKDYDFYIKNSLDRYYGAGTSMTEVLEQSLNTGMTFVAKTIGPALMYNYLQKYGFGQRTDIEFANEAAGKMDYYENWTESELATHAFGQGITVTLLQLTNAFCAMANGGILMEPHIVAEVRHGEGNSTITEPKEIRRVISEETSSTITSMLVSVIENGLTPQAKLEDHYVAGKSGTAQTYVRGRAVVGAGTTVGTFCGYGPINDPKFVICVKYDRPRSTEWGGETSGIVFGQLADYLMNYYNIPPDKK